MKVLFFIDSLRAGGKERRFTELLKGLKRSSEIEFEIVLMSEDVHYIEIFNLDARIHFLVRKNKKDLSIFRKFYKICCQFNPQIVHAWDSMTVLYSIPSCKLLGIKLVNGMISDTPRKRNILNKRWLRAKISFPFSNVIVGNSNAGLGAYGAPIKKSFCIYNGIDFNRFNNLKSSDIIIKKLFGENSDKLFLIGMVAAFEPRKDYRTLIESAKSLISVNPSIRFILVGDGSEFTEIKNIVPQNIQDKIIFLGRRNDVESIINIFNIGVLLTNSNLHGEGISNSIIEYMAVSKPVIATRGGGTDEVVVPNKSGFLINAADSYQLTYFIQKLINSPDQGREMGFNGYNIVYNSFNLKSMTENYIKLYYKH